MVAFQLKETFTVYALFLLPPCASLSLVMLECSACLLVKSISTRTGFVENSVTALMFQQ